LLLGEVFAEVAKLKYPTTFEFILTITDHLQQ
jgi:hypothetical protein